MIVWCLLAHELVPLLDCFHCHMLMEHPLGGRKANNFYFVGVCSALEKFHKKGPKVPVCNDKRKWERLGFDLSPSLKLLLSRSVQSQGVSFQLLCTS